MRRTTGLLAFCLVLGLTQISIAQEIPAVSPKIQQTTVPTPVLLPPPVDIQVAISSPLSAREAARITLANQISIQIARLSLAAGNARVGAAQAALYPSLDTSTGYTKVNPFGSATGSTTSGFSSSVSINQLVFDFNITRDTVRQSQALAKGLRYGLTQSQSDSVLATKQAYYAFYQSEQLVLVSESNLRDREAQFALANARYTSGIGAPSDVNMAQTNQDAAVLQLAQQRSAALTSRVALARSMGVDPLTPIAIEESIEPTRADEVPGLLKLALIQRPEILQANESLRAARFGVSIAGKSTTPSVGLNLGWSGQGTSSLSDSSRTTAGVFLSWSLFDGGLARARRTEASANAISAQKQIDQLIQSVTADVANAYVALRTSEQTVQITTTQVTNAQESVRLAEGRYRAGLATFLEITDSEASLTQAKINHVIALASLQQDRASLEHAIGSPV